MLISGFPYPAPGHQGPVLLLQPQVPPAGPPALLDLPRLSDDAPTERERHLDRAPGAYQHLGKTGESSRWRIRLEGCRPQGPPQTL